jgi:hypothetical protein
MPRTPPCRRRAPLTALLPLLLLGLGWPTQPPAAISMDLDTLSWLVGCWQLKNENTVIDEHWMPAEGDSMLGMSRTVRDGKLVGYELILLIQTDVGLVYRAHPSGQAMANFHATQSTRRGVVFENPDHDFPKRIGYWSQGSDRLTARVDDGGDERHFELEYKRTDCPTGQER